MGEWSYKGSWKSGSLRYLLLKNRIMYKVKLSPEEALETIKLRMKYDSSKTLTENVGVVDEQGLAGNPMTGQASGGQTYGRTYNYDTSGPKWYDIFVKWNGSTKSKVRDDQFWRYDSDGTIWNFKKNGDFIYQYPSNKGVKGKWVVNGTNFKITMDDGDEYDSKANKWKSNTSTGAASTGAASTAATSTSSIPAELKDVKAFQTWLDKNKPGWHDKYNTLGTDPDKGYGKFGPRTSKAWSTYKDEYLKGTNTPTVTPTPTGNPDFEVDDKDAGFDQPF
jgi:hypothetical protein